MEKNTSTPSSFNQFLSLEYLEFAKFELYEMKDEIDANHFAYKSSLSINKNKFYPENPKNWNIPNKYIEEAISLGIPTENLFTTYPVVNTYEEAKAVRTLLSKEL